MLEFNMEFLLGFVLFTIQSAFKQLFMPYSRNGKCWLLCTRNNCVECLDK